MRAADGDEVLAAVQCFAHVGMLPVQERVIHVRDQIDQVLELGARGRYVHFDDQNYELELAVVSLT